MPIFYYTAKTLDGQSKTGEIEAKDEKELSGLLRQEGYFLLTSEIKDGKSGKKGFDLSRIIRGLSGVSLGDKVFFTRNLAIMLKAGVPIIRALGILARQASSPKFKKVILKCGEEIGRGNSLSQAFSNNPDIFNELFTNMIKVGEESGNLEEILELLAGQLEKENKLRNKVMGAMLYPAIIIFAMVGIGVFMMITVVPTLSQTFTEMNIELPLTTRFVLGTSSILAKFWYLLPVALIGMFLLTRFLMRMALVKKISNTLVLRLPVIGALVRQFNSAVVSRTLASLIKGGVAIVKSMDITSRVLKNYFYRQSLIEISKEIEKGKNLSELFARYEDIYPALVIEMVKVGEETGNLSDMLERIAEFYEDEVSRATENLSTIIEPALMIVIGAVVGFFAVSMIQPMYSMMGAIK